MPNDKELDALAENDSFLEHLVDLQTHEGFRQYREWITIEIARRQRELESVNADFTGTSILRGGIAALRMCYDGLETMITDRIDTLKREGGK